MNVINCPAPQAITLRERLGNVRIIPNIINGLPGLVFADFRVVEIGDRFLSVLVPGGPVEGPQVTRLSFNEPLALIFPVRMIDQFDIIARGIINIQAPPLRAIADFDGLEVGVIRIGKDFIEVLARPEGFVTSRILFPLNRFTTLTCIDDDEE